MSKFWLRALFTIAFLQPGALGAQEPTSPECTQEDILDCLAPLVFGRAALSSGTDIDPREQPSRQRVVDLNYRNNKVVFFASTRRLVNPSIITPTTRLDRVYSADQDGSLSVGRAKVSWLRETESLNGGVAWRISPDRDFRIANARVIVGAPSWSAPSTADEMWKLVLQETKIGSNEAVSVLVHGYNNTMEESLAFAGLWASDIEAAGPIVLLSWPSEALEIARQRAKYVNAQDRGRRNAAPLLSALLAEAVEKKYQPFVFAHSMGSYVLINAIQDWTVSLQERIPFVLLTAPDIGVASFVDRLTGDRLLFGNRYIIYCSDADEALDQSKSYDPIQGHRLGDCNPGLHALPGDTSLIFVRKNRWVLNDTGDLGHGYHLMKGSVVQHMKATIKDFPNTKQLSRRID